jgi:hypothetical protein
MGGNRGRLQVHVDSLRRYLVEIEERVQLSLNQQPADPVEPANQPRAEEKPRACRSKERIAHAFAKGRKAAAK